MDEPCGVREGDRLADAFEEPQPLGQVGHVAKLLAAASGPCTRFIT